MNFYDIQQKVFKAVGNKQSLIIILVVLIFLVAAVYTYRKFITGRVNKKYVANDEFTKESENDSADIYLFYTEWCPHCKTAKPIWYDFKKEMEGKTVNGIKLNFFEVDCDKDTASSDKFNVKGFPTIKLVKGNQIIEYDAKPNKATLIEFVNSSL
jgi:thiol-disulfide isomerase/thioredoxin